MAEKCLHCLGGIEGHDCPIEQTGSNSASVAGYVPLVRKVLNDCHKKIDLYNQNDQRYLGGVEATRLLKNIEEVLSVLPE